MRTVKFRGLRTDGKGWVYGMLFHNNKIVTETVSYESPLVEKGSPNYKYEYINVIPESVGQFTGLKDKNGKECFEGDIVKMYRHSDDTNKHEVSKVWKDGKYIERICEVKFIHSSFVVWSELIQSHSAFMYMARPGESFEIIGNIHESPELLK